SPPGPAACTATPTGSGATIPLRVGRKNLSFPPPMQREGGSVDINQSRCEPSRSDATSVAAPLPNRTQRPRAKRAALRRLGSQRLAGPLLRQAPRPPLD